MKMEGLEIIQAFFILSLASSLAFAFASDPSPLQDFCEADPNGSVSVNGKVCKGAKLARVDNGNTHAVAFASLNSQNPGVITVSNAVFGSNPPINAHILAKAFHLDRKTVKNLQFNS
ncbi:putative germin-like protein subfamily 1 member 12 [Hibiscus syriacus]|uniref:Germin-like protein subfamily 1 member 12 n=1 Tax=Hibiscus syriacus TaxID=106335 RepID=A0A6A3AYA9_HIBSY|nr:putative germin-like protein subfamily 1 member 12 [Hibiscus syriacus]